MKAVCFSLSSLVDGGKIRKMAETILCKAPNTPLQLDHRFLNLNGGKAESWPDVAQRLADWGFEPDNLGHHYPIVIIEQSVPFALELANRHDFRDSLLLLYRYDGGNRFTVHGFYDRRLMAYMINGELTDMMLPPLRQCA